MQVLDELQAREASLQKQIKAKQQELLLQVPHGILFFPFLPHK
jgi:hypothetical protein